MNISYNAPKKRFTLNTAHTTYAFEIWDNLYPVHLYYGPKAVITHGFKPEDFNSFSPNPNFNNKSYSLDTLPLEFSSFGNSDYRTPSVQIEFENGSKITDFIYEGFEIVPFKAPLKTLPASFSHEKDEAETLILTLKDLISGCKIELYYSVFPHTDVITKSTKILNSSQETLKVLALASGQIDFHHSNFDLIHLCGAWARERDLVRTSVHKTAHAIESKRGASGHHQNPFMALVDPNTTEFHGDCYGFNLIYSGSFKHQLEVSPYDQFRVVSGLNPFNFSWVLLPDESFESPEMILTYSANGLNQMSQNFHHFIKQHVLSPSFAYLERPVLINNWEATYFDFDEDKLKALICSAEEMGAELFVLDDGWFGNRNDDTSSLGDWFENPKKLPNGIKAIAQFAVNHHVNFGLWVEPEMVSKNSHLYRAHPEYCLQTPSRPQTEGRNQLILDLSNSEVCDMLFDNLATLLKKAPISYVKWDMNRNMTEVYSERFNQGEVEHRYYLGLYALIKRLTTAFPSVLFEGCSGGGGRFDLGILHFMPQNWTSDNTDAVARLKIQYATSLAYPIITMGAHISAVPNHQTGRVTPFSFRAHVAMSGNLGVELDPTALTENDLTALSEFIKLYKSHRQLIQNGSFYRISSPFENTLTAWCFLSSDAREILLFAFRPFKIANMPLKKIKCPYADENLNYGLVSTSFEDTKPEAFSDIHGSQLKYDGLYMPHAQGDFKSCYWYLKSF
ncbi:alpha-galactosidase [Fusibacter sp. 3D3]|uniref:alpha-galactosidase n=1 Tax=Fusibacter sp. 3D3 TaxID=1048380 RepID=UPI000853A46E|nr:alpha-galactosidase [Fusibacter sp. 3D3]GAU79385.1 alpha-galactosidase [Fusibacter sp. 3D3]